MGPTLYPIDTSLPTAQLAQRMKACLNNLRFQAAELHSLAGSIQQCVYTDAQSKTNYSAIETQLGLTGNGATDNTSVGYAVQYQINAADAALQSAGFQQFLEQLI